MIQVNIPLAPIEFDSSQRSTEVLECSHRMSYVSKGTLWIAS